MKRATRRLGRRKNRRTTQRTRKLPRQGNSFGPLRVVLALLALGGAVVGVRYGYLTLRYSERLQVSTIEVEGSSRTRPAELRAYSGISNGDAILHVDLDRAALALRRHPWVKNASVRRTLPGTVTLQVTEHEPVIMVALRELYLANADGELFKRVSPEDGLVFPVVTGLRRDLEPEESAGLVRAAVALLRAAQAGRLGSVDELAYDAHLGWTLVTRAKTGAVRVHLGTDPVTRLPVAERALARLGRMGRDPEMIWADSTENPRRVQVRLRRTPATENSQTLIATAR